MKEEDQGTHGGCNAVNSAIVSRRAVMGSSGLGVLAILSAMLLGRESRREGEPGRPPQGFLERMEQSRAFSERMRDAASMEERTKIMEERNAWERKRAVEDLKEQLGISDAEWTVIRPRVEAVYNLVHPLPSFGPGNAQARTPVEQRSRELREILGDKDAKAEEIKAKLTALRAAKEQARQELVKARESLRQIMSLRQEAVLVLNGLLD